MKVLHIIHGLNTGGAETLVKDYVLNLDKKLFEPVVLCYDHYKDSPYEELLSKNNIKVIYVCDYMKFYGKKNIIAKFINHIQRYLLIKKYIRIENPDILHTHLPINKYIKFSKPQKKVKIFHTVHSEPKVLWNLKNKRLKKDFNAAKWLVKKNNMRFIVLHDKMKQEVNEMFNVNNSIILNNGIDFSRFNNPVSKKDMRKKLNIVETSFVVGHVGRFSKVKNHDFLIDVFYEIYKIKNNSFLLMIGSGEEEEKIVNKLHDLKLDNHYMILSNRNDIPNLLNVMDVFIFPSMYEGLGISLIEAQKMNLPCFKSDNVPNFAVISNLVTSLSLELSAKKWSDAVLYYKIPNTIILNDEQWNMKKVIKKLEKIYLNKI